MKRILILTMIFILVFSSLSFATNTYDPSVHKYFIKLGNDYLVSDFKFHVNKRESGKWYLDSPPEYTYYFECDYIDNNFVVKSKMNGTNRGNGTLSYLTTNLTESNYDVLNITDNDVFFSLPMWATSMEGAESHFLTPLQMLLPIILGLLVCGVALQKGWKMLKTQLSGA